MIKHDTFRALWNDKIEKLLLKGDYDAIRGEINNELRRWPAFLVAIKTNNSGG